MIYNDIGNAFTVKGSYCTVVWLNVHDQDTVPDNHLNGRISSTNIIGISMATRNPPPWREVYYTQCASLPISSMTFELV